MQVNVEKRRSMRSAYEAQAEEVNRKIELVIRRILDNTGAVVSRHLGPVGDDPVPDPRQKGYYAGDPTLHIEGTDLWVNITGPNTGYSSVRDDIWIRPDKMRNAFVRRVNKNETVLLVHVIRKSVVRPAVTAFLRKHRECFISKYPSIDNVLGLLETMSLSDSARCYLGKRLSLFDRGTFMAEDVIRSVLTFYAGRNLCVRGDVDRDYIRVIPLDLEFEVCSMNREFGTGGHSKYGMQEEFVAVPWNHPVVRGESELYEIIRDSISVAGSERGSQEAVL